jgi:hypothetical protein
MKKRGAKTRQPTLPYDHLCPSLPAGVLARLFPGSGEFGALLGVAARPLELENPSNSPPSLLGESVEPGRIPPTCLGDDGALGTKPRGGKGLVLSLRWCSSWGREGEPGMAGRPCFATPSGAEVSKAKEKVE